MYNRPPPLTAWLATTRPASMVCALIRPGSSDCKPYSPNATELPRVALPLTRLFWLFRYSTRLGIRAIAGRQLQIVALVDPYLDPDVALRRLGLGEAVVDLGPEGGQGHRPGRGRLGPRHLRAAQPARELDLHALGAAVHRLLQRPLHRAAEARPLLQLLGDVLADELRVDLAPRALDDLDLDPPAGPGLELHLALRGLGPLAADDHPRPRRREQDGDRVAGPLDLDLGDPGEAILLLDEAADLEVLDQEVAELVLGRVPAAPPVLHDAHSEAGRSDLLAHKSNALLESCPLPVARCPGGWAALGLRRHPATGDSKPHDRAAPLADRPPPASFVMSARPMAMWHDRRRIRYAIPRARGISRLNIGPPSPWASTTTSSPTLRMPLSSALAMALLSTCSISRAPR